MFLDAEVQKLFDNWIIGTHKVFWYYTYTYHKPDIVILLKFNDNIFTCKKDYSTIPIKNLELDELKNMISSNILRWHKEGAPYTNYKKKHNPEGCTCGSWRTRFPKYHYDWCDSLKKLPPIPF